MGSYNHNHVSQIPSPEVIPYPLLLVPKTPFLPVPRLQFPIISKPLWPISQTMLSNWCLTRSYLWNILIWIWIELDLNIWMRSYIPQIIKLLSELWLGKFQTVLNTHDLRTIPYHAIEEHKYFSIISYLLWNKNTYTPHSGGHMCGLNVGFETTILWFMLWRQSSVYDCPTTYRVTQWQILLYAVV